MYARNILWFRYIIVNTVHKRVNKDDDDVDNDNCKITTVRLKNNGVRIFQTLFHPVYPWEPTKWNGPVNCNEPEGTACDTENSCS
jgi:hypothetical protein